MVLNQKFCAFMVKRMYRIYNEYGHSGFLFLVMVRLTVGDCPTQRVDIVIRRSEHSIAECRRSTMAGLTSTASCDHVGTKVELHENGVVKGMNGTWPKPFLTKEDLAAYFASGCKAKANWRSDLDI